MSGEEYTKLFNQIAKTEFGTEQNLEEIERRLEHLRKGHALSYEDLDKIADPKCWKFNKYWMWPHRSQIEKKLENTAGFFSALPKDEEKTIGRLNTIFKDIALVSIILRFARPDLYAIYSYPVLQILRIERGKNAVEDYMNYIREMRILKHCFQVRKTAEVDKIVWAIFYLKGRYADELKRILAKILPENLTAEEIIIHLSHSPLKIAREYLKRKDHLTAGLWAAKAFERFLEDECREQGIYVEPYTYKMSNMIKELRAKTVLWNQMENRGLLYRAKDIRNIIIHETQAYRFQDVEEIISAIEDLEKTALHKSR